MTRRGAVLSSVGGTTLLVLLAMWFQPASAQSQEQPKPPEKPGTARDFDEKGRPPLTLRDFMRKKLEASSLILEGLALEDLKLVEQGARALHEMSAAERWRVHNDAMYRQFSTEFRHATGDLIRAAENDNLDQAALKWMATTMGCIECHRFVRTHLVAAGEVR